MYTKTVVLTDDEVWPLLNILNEICHGISVKNFEQTIGVNKNVVIFLMDRISQHKNKTSYLTLNEKELNIIENCFNEVFRQIEEWEFQTRIGISVQEAIRIKNRTTLRNSQ